MDVIGKHGIRWTSNAPLFWCKNISHLGEALKPRTCLSSLGMTLAFSIEEMIRFFVAWLKLLSPGE